MTSEDQDNLGTGIVADPGDDYGLLGVGGGLALGLGFNRSRPDQINRLVELAKRLATFRPRSRDEIESEQESQPAWMKSQPLPVLDREETTPAVRARYAVDAALNQMKQRHLHRANDELKWPEAYPFLPALRERGVNIDAELVEILKQYVAEVANRLAGYEKGKLREIERYHFTQIGYEQRMADCIQRRVAELVVPIIAQYIDDVLTGHIELPAIEK